MKISLWARTADRNHHMRIISYPHIIFYPILRGRGGLWFVVFFFLFSPMISWFLSLAYSDHVKWLLLHFHSKGCKSYCMQNSSPRNMPATNFVTLAIYSEQANMINRNGMMPGNLRKFKAKQIKCMLISWWGFVCYMYEKKTSSQSNLEPQIFFLHSEFLGCGFLLWCSLWSY